MKMHVASIFMFIATLYMSGPVIAAWSPNPTENNPVATLDGYNNAPVIVSDGSGGSIIAWVDGRRFGSSQYGIYAQRIDANGATLWTTDGVAICTAEGNNYQVMPTIVITSDGDGGAVVAWTDFRNGTQRSDIYAQRINASGAVQWAVNGVAISTAPEGQGDPVITSDGSGGAVIAWTDTRNGDTNSDIYAQRVDGSGSIQWAVNGAAVSTAAANQANPAIAYDGVDKFIIAWTDYRNGNFTADANIYAQVIGASGILQWDANGSPITRATDGQTHPIIVNSGNDAVIVAWTDFRNGTTEDIYAQRVAIIGGNTWPADVAISTAPNYQFAPKMISDGNNGAIITWVDYRSSSNQDIYAQRINVSGVVQWAANGVPVSTATSHQSSPRIASDGSGGAIIAWTDARSGVSNDIYAQRLNANGASQWAANGVVVSEAVHSQSAVVLAGDGNGGALMAWEDTRNNPGSSQADVYAQLISAAGTLGAPIQADCLFNWAEQQYPNFLAPAGASSATWGSYYYRFYSGTNAYLATNGSDNHVYFMGPATGHATADLGATSVWLAQAGCR